jgi:NADH dehydrogenase FAD-containing subunit
MEGLMPGKEVVILGSGDIGLIMARRMTLEGAVVKMVVELMPYSGGLKRNIIQCLDDYGIPLRLSHTVIDIDGRERVKGVTVARVGEDRKPVAGTEEYIACDTLLLSVGLIPENELSRSAGVKMDPVTSGPIVNESLETSLEGIFACGNVLHVHDLVDYVSIEAALAGRNAAKYVRKIAKNENILISELPVEVTASLGVRYTIPQTINPENMEETQKIRFRVDNIYRDTCICVNFNDREVIRRKKKFLSPGEMEEITLNKSDLTNYPDLKKITIKLAK